jgi:catechol 2,3-dioxygenase-like lactoylglutathione lyase family enzyme
VPSSTRPARGPPGTPQDPNRLSTVTAITLLVEDLPLTRRFYERVFCVEPTREDEHSAAFSFNGGALAVSLYMSSDAREHRLLGRGVHVGRMREVGRRFQLRVAVESVDEVYARLRRLEEEEEVEEAKGEGEGWPLVVEGLTGPRLRPWGARTVTFQDPAGHCWEVAEEN